MSNSDARARTRWNPLRPQRRGTARRNVAGTLGTTLVVQLALLVTGIASARILGVEDRGYWAFLQLLLLVLPILVLAGLPVSLTYWIARDPSTTRPLLLSLRRLIGFQLACVLVVHGLALYIAFRNAPGYVIPAAAVSLIGSVSVAVWSLAVAVLQGSQRFGLLNLARALSPALSAVLLLVALAAGIGNIFIVTLTVVSLLAVSATITVLAALRAIPPETAEDASGLPGMRQVLAFGIKGLLGASSPVEAFQLDQAIVGIFMSKAQLGIYVVGVAFTNLPRFIAQSIGLVAYPRIAADPDPRGRIRGILTFAAVTFALAGTVAVVLELALPHLLPWLFGDAFAPAVEIAQILLVAAVLFALRRVLAEGLRGAGRPGLGSLAEVAALASLLPAAALFSDSGASGIALALVVSAAVGLCAIVLGLIVRPLPKGQPQGDQDVVHPRPDK